MPSLRKAAMAFSAALLLSALAPLPGRAATYVNPLKGNLDVHDPVLVMEKGTYYIFWTGDRIPMKSSADRVTWINLGPALDISPAWLDREVPGRKDIWAPDVHFSNGLYWMYYAVSIFGTSNSAIGLMTSPTVRKGEPGYLWQDKGMVIRTDAKSNYNAIDANAFIDKDGSNWLVFGSFWSGIKLFALNAETGMAKENPPSLFSLASHPSGIEGSYLWYRGGYYYLFVSYDQCCRGVESTYKIAVGRAEKLTGPYVDDHGKPMLQGAGMLLDTGDARWIGPGHCSVFLDHDTTFLVNHAYDAQNNGKATLMIRPMFWTAAGWPTLDSALATAGTGMHASVAKAGKRRAGVYWSGGVERKAFLRTDGQPRDVKGSALPQVSFP